MGTCTACSWGLYVLDKCPDNAECNKKSCGNQTKYWFKNCKDGYQETTRYTCVACDYGCNLTSCPAYAECSSPTNVCGKTVITTVKECLSAGYSPKPSCSCSYYYNQQDCIYTSNEASDLCNCGYRSCSNGKNTCCTRDEWRDGKCTGGSSSTC